MRAVPTSYAKVSLRKGGVGDRTFTVFPVTEAAGTLREDMAAVDRKAPVSRGNAFQLSSFQYCSETVPT
jgi:hypothetical protein